MFRRFLGLGQRKPVQQAGQRLYAQLLEPPLLAEVLRLCQLSDTLSGRFAALSLCAALVLDGREDRAQVERDFVGAMVADIDTALRERSLGDATVKKQAKNHAAALYGRLRAYQQALAQPEEALAQVLRRNLYTDTPSPLQEQALPQVLPGLRSLLQALL